MDASSASLPAPETLLASALFLMTYHARTRCPLLTRMIAQQLHHLAHHPSASVPPQLRAVCDKLSQQWGNARAAGMAGGGGLAATDAATLLH
ncbi:MAG TPA: hypothetical protein VHA15_03605 [Burkholderiales bacterium]|jgi:hypothetical protein|nr:hypothetical protein [Burkholderiales bacterium]